MIVSGLNINQYAHSAWHVREIFTEQDASHLLNNLIQCVPLSHDKDFLNGRNLPDGVSRGVWPFNKTSVEIYEHILTEIENANDETWQLNISGMFEPAAILKIDKGGYIPLTPLARDPLENDSQPLRPLRKLAVFIPLTDPNDYEGGTVVPLGTDWASFEGHKIPGHGIVIKADTWTEITPVTKGSVTYMMCLAHGPHLV